MDTYVELLIKRNKNKYDFVWKAIVIALTVILLLLGLGNIVFFAAGIVMGFCTYYIYLNSDVEYEYLYINQELTVDKIMAKARRKTLLTIDVNKISLLVPFDSHEAQGYKNRNIKKLDFSSGNEEAERYVIIYNDGREQKFIIMEFNDKLLTHLKSHVR